MVSHEVFTNRIVKKDVSAKVQNARTILFEEIMSLSDDEVLARAGEVLNGCDGVFINDGTGVRSATSEDLAAQNERILKINEASELIRKVKTEIEDAA